MYVRRLLHFRVQTARIIIETLNNSRMLSQYKNSMAQVPDLGMVVGGGINAFGQLNRLSGLAS